MKTGRVILAAVVAVAIGVAVSWCRTVRNREVEYWFRMFTTTLAQGKQTEAYALTSGTFRRTHTLSDFVGSPWCDSSNVVNMTAVQRAGMHQVYVQGMNPLSRRVRVVTSTAALTLPLFLEDGFIATIVPMRKESDRWVVDGDVDTMMR